MIYYKLHINKNNLEGYIKRYLPKTKQAAAFFDVIRNDNETVIEETSVLDTTSDETDKPVEDTTSSEDKDTPISDTAEAEDSTTASESGNETAEESRPPVSTKPVDTLDLSDIPEVSLWAKLLGKVGLVPLIIIAGGFAGALLACFVIIPVAISDRCKSKKSNGKK